MAATAFQTQYRQETISTFEQRRSLLRDSVTTEAVIKGNTATFLVAGSGSATAVTRGTDGLIPARANDLTQTSATLAEWHDLVRMTNFNIFASQGDQREVAQKETVGVINRKVDSDILTTLATATQDTGTAQTASLPLVIRAQAILGQNAVPFDGNIWAVISPGFLGYLQQITEFGNSQYVKQKPLEGDGPNWNDMPGYYDWLNIKWVVHPNISGVGTNAEKCFMYHRSAIGHAMDTKGMDIDIGYEGEQAYSWARCSAHMGAALLQNSGVVIINHDSSAFAAE